MSPCRHEDTYIHMPTFLCQQSGEDSHLQLRSLNSEDVTIAHWIETIQIETLLKNAEQVF